MSGSSASDVGRKPWGGLTKRVVWVVAFILVLLWAAGAIAWVVLAGRNSSERSSLAGKSSRLSEPMKALGRLEPEGGVIEIGAIMGERLSELPVEKDDFEKKDDIERLSKLPVKEGDFVKKDEILAVLDSHHLRKLEIKAIEQQLHEAQARADAELRLAAARIKAANLALGQSTIRKSEIEAEALKLPVLDKAREIATKTRDRLSHLPGRVASDQDRDQAELAEAKANAEYEAAKKTLEKAKCGDELAQEAAQADLEVAEAGKAVAESLVPQALKKKLELTQAECDRSVLRAPVDGTVLKVFVHPGELIGQTPVLEMADLTHVVVVAQVYQSDVKQIREGQEAFVKSNSFHGPYNDDAHAMKGTVTFIGREISPPTMRELNPLAPTDRRSVDVRIKLDDKESKEAGQFVRMQVDVEFPVTAEPGK